MRALIFLAALALASPAFAQGEAAPPPKPTVESLTAENAKLQAIIQVLQAQRNRAQALASDLEAMREVEKVPAAPAK